MTVLGIETATVVCSAAIAVDGALVAEETLEQHAVHAEKLLTLIDRSLRTAGRTTRDLTAVAVSIGPGSFTGLRIGLSVAKGLVYATGCPIVAVPTLATLAHRVSGWEARPRGVPILTVLDARRDEVYCQLFTADGDEPVAAGDARDCTLAELGSSLPGGPVIVTGDARQKVAEFLSVTDGGTGRVIVAPETHARCSGGSVAILGGSLFSRGVVEDPAHLEPRYIKEFFLKSR